LKLRNEIDLDLAAKVVDRQMQQRSGDGDAGIVDEAGERFARGALRRRARQRDGRRRSHRKAATDAPYRP
jgi:hypothetical protein